MAFGPKLETLDPLGLSSSEPSPFVDIGVSTLPTSEASHLDDGVEGSFFTSLILGFSACASFSFSAFYLLVSL